MFWLQALCQITRAESLLAPHDVTATSQALAHLTDADAALQRSLMHWRVRAIRCLSLSFFVSGPLNFVLASGSVLARSGLHLPNAVRATASAHASGTCAAGARVSQLSDVTTACDSQHDVHEHGRRATPLRHAAHQGAVQ